MSDPFEPDPFDLAQQNKYLREECRQSERSLRRANKRIVNILDSITDMYVSLNRQWEITYVNARAELLLGVARKELVGRCLWEQYPQAEHPHLYTQFHHALARQTSVQFEDFCTQCGLWLDWHVHPSQDGLSLYGRDITAHKQAEERLAQNMIWMRHSLNGVIQAIGATVETRDPYTAEHQRRVSILAKHIARMLGLPAAQVEGVRIGALLHDVGKIAVPSEILSRPGPLSPAERSIVQMHVDVGYTILKDIDFAAPAALMARQHHERMDGSGYPQGLRGNEIILEARILAVADVVEAMASHRPHRPSLGLPRAVEEIMDGRGARYDANVVDACLKLFHASGYDLEQMLQDDAGPRSQSE